MSTSGNILYNVQINNFFETISKNKLNKYYFANLGNIGFFLHNYKHK